MPKLSLKVHFLLLLSALLGVAYAPVALANTLEERPELTAENHHLETAESLTAESLTTESAAQTTYNTGDISTTDSAAISDTDSAAVSVTESVASEIQSAEYIALEEGIEEGLEEGSEASIEQEDTLSDVAFNEATSSCFLETDTTASVDVSIVTSTAASDLLGTANAVTETLSIPESIDSCLESVTEQSLTAVDEDSALLLAADPLPPAVEGAPPISTELNLLVIRALRKPVTNKVLDTGVFIQGIRPRGDDNNPWERSFMTGNWGGLRDRLYDNGIDLVAGHFGEVYSNVSGGVDQGTTFSQVYIASGDFYTDRLGWWENGFFHLTGSWLTGNSLAREDVGSLNSVYFGDPPANGARLFESFYSHDFDNRRVNLRIGKIYPFVKLGASQTAGLFTNTSFDYPTFLGSSPSSGFSAAYGASPWGIQLGYNPSRQWNFIAHVMDGFDDPSGGIDNRSGLKFKLSGDEGAEGIFEALYRVNQQPGDTGLPGYYRAGIQGHSGRFNELSSLSSTNTTQQRGNYALYLTGEQMLYRESADPSDRSQGLNGFAKVAYSPEEDINLVSLHVSGGLAYEGIFPGRDRDVVGLGVAHTRFSEGARELDRAIQSTSERNAETVIELTYAAEIAPWWLIVGSAQHIIDPGGYSTVEDATVFGISNRFSF